MKPSSKRVNFTWSPAAGLRFSIEFTARGRGDSFGADCAWTEARREKQDPVSWLSRDPFRDEAFLFPHARVQLQSLSLALHDNPRVLFWHFWQPSAELGDTPESHAVWTAEFIAEELRPLLDSEAQQRVEAAVDQAMGDLKRCALPWFEKKLQSYLKKDS